MCQYDVHNLDIENRTILTDPREDVRWDNIKIVKVTLSTTSEQDSTGPDIELVTDVVKMLTLSKQFKCPECKAVFKIEGKLKQHTRTVHNQTLIIRAKVQGMHESIVKVSFHQPRPSRDTSKLI